ncbi:MAG: type II toxin-antitoxin system PemK/MazF family toxin [Candidatus Pacebacteria bacterium]|nr:type II toxin-antitoxin system PemK/MazF family toxin [Candidatus Paceibacterota bacterium]
MNWLVIRWEYKFMTEDIFNKWNEQKKEIDNNEREIFFAEREIWNIKMGKNIGFEEDGKGEDFLRPVLILKKFSKEIFWGIPLTSSCKKEYPQFYCSFIFKGGESVAILTQIKLYSTRRLYYKMGRIGEKNFNLIKQKLITLIGNEFL